MCSNKIISVILRGKLHKLSYECYCADVCQCDPKQLVQKYMDMLIDEVYNSHNFDDEEEEDIDFDKEEQYSVGNREGGFITTDPRSSGDVTVKYDEEQKYNSTSVPEVSTKIDRSRAFLRGLDLDSNAKDIPHLPAGRFDNEDVIDPKAIPEGILAYKNFHVKRELGGANKCKKRTSQGINAALTFDFYITLQYMNASKYIHIFQKADRYR